MSYRSFLKPGRTLLAACAVSLVTASLCAQTAPAAPATGDSNPSRVDIFLGYSYMGSHGQVKPAGINFSSVDLGVMASGAYYFNKYVGGEINFIGNPNGTGSGGDGFYSGYAGPIFRAPMQNFTLFAHGLAGGVRGSGPNSDIPASYEHEPWRWGAGLVAGGGMDYDLPWWNHALSLRLFEADYRYIHLDYGPSTTVPTGGVLGGRANLGAAELSSGLVFHIGHILPPPPVAYACAVTAPTGVIYPGDTVTITGTATNLDPKKNPTYTWTGDSGVSPTGSSNVASVDTKALSAGTYTVKGHVTQGAKPYQSGDCSTQFTVKAFDPPTVSCSASPSTINSGDSSTITANGMSPQNRPLTYSYSATAGSISGSTSTTTLSTAGVAPGTSISVTCNVVDDKGQSASQMTTVSLNNPPPPPVIKPTTKQLCSISFDRDAKRPTRVDNEAKACLDDIALAAQRDPSSKFAIVGTSASDEKMADQKAGERAANAEEYLTKEKGVDASRITLYTGPAGSKSVATTEIVDGSTLDTTGLTPYTPPAPKPAPKHHKKK